MPPILRIIRMIACPNVVNVSSIVTGVNPVTLTPDTATNNVSTGAILTPGLTT